MGSGSSHLVRLGVAAPTSAGVIPRVKLIVQGSAVAAPTAAAACKSCRRVVMSHLLRPIWGPDSTRRHRGGARHLRAPPLSQGGLHLGRSTSSARRPAGRLCSDVLL